MENDLAHRLIKARSGHGWSQAELSEVSGVAAAQISRYESGRTTPRPEVLAKLAKALAVGFDWLVYGKGTVDVGADVPMYPASQTRSISVDLDPETRSAMAAIAERNGLTVEMVLKQLVLMAVQEENKDPADLLEAIRAFRESK